MFYVISKRTSRLLLLALVLLVLGLYIICVSRGQPQQQDLVDGQLMEIEETVSVTALQRTETTNCPRRVGGSCPSANGLLQ